MKKLIILLTLIYAVFSTFDSCYECYDHSECANIKIEFDGFSCYKYKSDYRLNKCVPFPDDKTSQEAYYNMDMTYLKEVISSGLYTYALDDITIYGPEKKIYDKGETIVTKILPLTPVDKDIFSSKNSCFYQLYGRFVDNFYKNGVTSYPNVNNKNLCFNSDKFEEALNLLDCGYAEITFPLNGKDFKMTTCYLFPNNKMPEKVQNIFNKHFIESQILTIKQIANGQVNKQGLEKWKLLASKNSLINLVEKTSEKLSKNELRKLQSTDVGIYELVIENKYGKKYKYTNSVQDKPIVISEGNKEEEEKADEIQRIKANKSNYFKLNKLFSLFLILLL